MKIRTRIALYLAPFVCLTLIAIFSLNYRVIRSRLAENAQQELAKVHENMYRSAQSLLDSATSNYLRGITEKNLSYVEAQYYAVRAGTQSKQTALDNIQKYFNQQIIGLSGYMVAVREQEDRLFLEMHPYLKEEDCTDRPGCVAWHNVRNGYVSYDWENPDDSEVREKVAYVREFMPWNWIVGASSYREEFVKLINIEDLRQLVQPVRINKSGYFVVISENREVLIHPELEKLEPYELVNSEGLDVLDLMISKQGEYVTYKWKNPSEKTERLKYAFGEKLEGYNWYLIATGYVDEIYEPIKYFRELTVFLVLLSGCALLFIIFRLSQRISTPLRRMEQGIGRFYTRKEMFRWDDHSRINEIDVLGNAFARMTNELNHSVQDLEEKNRELAKSEEEKEAARHFLDSIINSMPSVIIGVDRSFVVTEWNQQAERVMNVSKTEARGILLFDLCSWLEPQREVLLQALAENDVKVLPITRSDEQEGTTYLELTVYPLVVSGKEGAVLRIDEVTDRVEMEQRLRQSQKMDAVGQLAGGVAHDFNNMLSGIIGAAELLSIKAGPEEQKLVKVITEASGRAGELIQKLLAFSRKGSVDFVPVDVHEIIESTIEILKRSLDKRITIHKKLEAESATVMGEGSQLQSSLLNIGINAGHAMDREGDLFFESSVVVLDTYYCQTSHFDITPGRYIQIRVRDTGCGISEEHLRKIFEPFFTTRQNNKGTGLGLAAVYGAIQQHHGAVSVYSEPGRGTEFSLLLPLSETGVAEPAREKELVHGSGCVLLVDDEPVVRVTARLMLEKLGYSVLEAEDGSQGVDMFTAHQEEIDIVLLDMVMPVMDGTTCFYKLCEIDPGVKVVISSGFTRDADLGQLREKGLVGFVRKPYNMVELSETLAGALR